MLRPQYFIAFFLSNASDAQSWRQDAIKLSFFTAGLAWSWAEFEEAICGNRLSSYVPTANSVYDDLFFFLEVTIFGSETRHIHEGVGMASWWWVDKDSLELSEIRLGLLFHFYCWCLSQVLDWINIDSATLTIVVIISAAWVRLSLIYWTISSASFHRREVLEVRRCASCWLQTDTIIVIFKDLDIFYVCFGKIKEDFRHLAVSSSGRFLVGEPFIKAVEHRYFAAKFLLFWKLISNDSFND